MADMPTQGRTNQGVDECVFVDVGHGYYYTPGIKYFNVY